MVVAATCFVVAFASSFITADVAGVQKDLRVSEELALLTISLFVVGLGLGPMVFAPLSEVLGRRIVYSCTLLLAAILTISCALAPNIQILLVNRAIAFSAPMTLVGGTLADVWKIEKRGVPMAAFSTAPLLEIAIGPLAGGNLPDAKAWRWLYWIQLVFAGTGIIIILIMPETYASTILARRAKKKIRKETDEMDHVAEAEIDKKSLTERMQKLLIRPFQLLFVESIVYLVTIYMCSKRTPLHILHIIRHPLSRPPNLSKVDHPLLTPITATQSATAAANDTPSAKPASCSSPSLSASYVPPFSPHSKTVTTSTYTATTSTANHLPRRVSSP